MRNPSLVSRKQQLFPSETNFKPNKIVTKHNTNQITKIKNKSWIQSLLKVQKFKTKAKLKSLWITRNRQWEITWMSKTCFGIMLTLSKTLAFSNISVKLWKCSKSIFNCLRTVTNQPKHPKVLNYVEIYVLCLGTFVKDVLEGKTMTCSMNVPIAMCVKVSLSTAQMNQIHNEIKQTRQNLSTETERWKSCNSCVFCYLDLYHNILIFCFG